MTTPSTPSAPSVTRRTLPTWPDGTAVDSFVLRNGRGLELEALSFGGIVTRLLVPDRAGRLADVVLGYHDPELYRTDASYFGAIVGRCANRIAGGRFRLDGREVRLPVNNHPGGQGCHLHGGFAGFDKRAWAAEPLHRPDAAGVRFTRRSPDGEEGYPGNLDVEVTYWLTTAHEWRIEYACGADQPTPVNLTQHTSFNLAGEGSGDILGHELVIRAARYTPVTAGLIPTGEIAPVDGTPFDFTTPRRIGERIQAAHPQLGHGRGYDHNWVLDSGGGSLAEAATLRDPASGRVMDVLTTEPGLQLYTGNFLDGSRRGKTGRPHAFRTGLCLETQHFPNSPNQPDFPSVILRPGARRVSTTVYRFSARPISYKN